MQNKLYLTHESGVEGVSESKDGPIKSGHDEDKAEANDVNNGTCRTKKRTLELRPKRTSGEQKVADVKPEHSIFIGAMLNLWMKFPSLYGTLLNLSIKLC